MVTLRSGGGRLDAQAAGHTVPVEPKLLRLLPWSLRAAWVAVGLSVTSVVDDVAPGGDVIGSAIRVCLAAAWIGGAVATTFPAVMTLTIVRTLIPLAVPVTIAAWTGGADPVSGATALVASLTATALASTAELGRGYVQASAYGAEDRHLLRPPPAYLAASVVAWCVASTALTIGGAALIADRPIGGAALAALGLAITVWAAPRWHRLSRRWLVAVPAGVVVHDHLVLAETLMITRAELAGVTLALTDTTAADLTGPAGGHTLEISTHQPVTAVLAATPERPGGRAIHLSAALVAPSRPGHALAAISRRRPTGSTLSR